MNMEERLARLERQNRFLLLVLVAVTGAFAVAATEDGVPDVVRAKAFHVVGKDGAVLVKLGASTDGYGMVATLDPKGQKLVILTSTTTDGEGTVITLNGKGQKLVELGVRKSGQGVVATYDPASIEARGVYTTRP